MASNLKIQRAHENDVFSCFQIQFGSDAAYHDESIVRNARNFRLAAFIEDKVNVPFKVTGDFMKVSSIQLR